MQREVWLVKVPEIIANSVRRATQLASSTGTEVKVGALTAAPKAPGPVIGKKRSRLAMRVQLDSAQLTEMFGTEEAARLPRAYALHLDEPSGTRLLQTTEPVAPPPAASSAAASAGAAAPRPTPATFAFVGVSTHQGAAIPDMRDPAYDAYTKHKREAERMAAAAAKRSTALLPDEEAPTLTELAARQAAAEAAEAAAAEARAPVAAPAAAIAPAASIYEMFERGAYWSIKDLCDATGAKEADLRPELQQTADYVRAGPHRGTYRLKPEYRTVSSAAADPNDGLDT
jgi:hypothetical protein